MSDWGALLGLVTIRPLSMDLHPEERLPPFSAGWSSTRSLLIDEIRHLSPREVILEAAFREQDLRLDGMPRASARAEHDGVILTLVGTPHGDLRYPCASFTGRWGTPGWQMNLRAIALALEALRKVDRYGVTKRGEQYAGWKALESPDSKLRARGDYLIGEHGSVREAQRRTHPDTGGDAEDFKAVTAAAAARE